jgi:hypothetical protein
VKLGVAISGHIAYNPMLSARAIKPAGKGFEDSWDMVSAQEGHHEAEQKKD